MFLTVHVQVIGLQTFWIKGEGLPAWSGLRHARLARLAFDQGRGIVHADLDVPANMIE